MPIQGYKRYFKLFQNIQNPTVYLFNKIKPSEKALSLITKPNAIKFQVSKNLLLIFKEIFMSDVYGIEQLCKELPENSTVLDIGMNVGFFDILLLSKITVFKIYAYEPVPLNVATFQKTINNNKLLLKNIVLHQMAVTGKHQDRLDLYLEDVNKNSVDASVLSNFDVSHAHKISVPCITFSDIIFQNNLKQIDFLKLDCEGSEFDIIYNTDQALIRQINKMIIEVHNLDNNTNNISFMNNYIQSIGYTTKYVRINHRCHVLTAVKNQQLSCA
jgi:FkbM family methyltransferase